MDDPTPPFLEPIEEEGLVQHFEAVVGRDHGWVKESPRGVLRHVVAGDPLSVYPACELCIANEALFVSAARLCCKALAIIARRSSSFDGSVPMPTWLARCVCEAVDQVFADDWEADQNGDPPEPSSFQRVEARFLVGPVRARRMSVAFNRLPRRTRRAFFAVGLQGTTVHRYVAIGNGPPSQVKADLERAYSAIGDILDGEVDR